MKTKKQIVIAITTSAILATAALNALAKACYDSHHTIGPDIQDPGCGAYDQNGGTDNNCTQIVVSPSYDQAYTAKTRTGYTYTGAGPGTVTITKTTIKTQCSNFPTFECNPPVTNVTTSPFTVPEPTHFNGC